MKPIPILAVLGILALSSFIYISRAGGNTETPENLSAPGERALAEETLNPYQPLKMEDIFVTPAGPKGLEYSNIAKSLAGKKVRVTGFMVRHAHADPEIFLFAPQRMVLLQSEFGIADDLPPYALHVITAAPAGKAASFFREQMELLGTLDLGQRDEMDGRVSHVRLKLDHAIDAASKKPLSLYASIALQPERLLNAERVKPASR